MLLWHHTVQKRRPESSNKQKYEQEYNLKYLCKIKKLKEALMAGKRMRTENEADENDIPNSVKNMKKK